MGTTSIRSSRVCYANPSSAVAEIDDQTIKRCRNFGKERGFAGIKVANLYALRATNPKELWTHADPIGIDNNRYLTKLVEEHKDIICEHRENGSHNAIFRKTLKEAFIIPIMNASFIYEMESTESYRRFSFIGIISLQKQRQR
ncbi:DUF1643 domain-containing protein [Guptibacillus hwajinpoensis]|uniref:DUF1643 domain-containing protein n=1 Tax=Guptibacillus hwajinpoensis TaxID=208199 RepID=UPI00384FFE38